jgi:hypothetical protein
MLDPRSLLSIAELTKPRTPAGLAKWVAETCDAIADIEEAREPALMHQRPFKEFYEEIYPLNLFVKHRYPGREDILVTPNLDNRHFDAVIRDGSVSPPSEVMVEITLARDPQEHLRMEHYLKHRRTSLGSQIVTSGNKRNRDTSVPIEFVEQAVLMASTYGWIKAAAEGKAAKPDRYGRSHVLLIAFEDWFKPRDEDIVTLTTFVTESVLTLPLNFATLYIVGLWGRTYLRFPILESSPKMTQRGPRGK